MYYEKKFNQVKQIKIIRIKKLQDFRFVPTVFSHGWHELLPFRFDDDQNKLIRVNKLKSGRIVELQIYEDELNLNISVDALKDGLNIEETKEIITTVSEMLNLNQDFSEFYDLLRKHKSHKWISRNSLGRLLISPTVWEDVVKTLLTTNTTWDVTKIMCKRLVSIGEEFSEGINCFPTPIEIASMDINILNEKIRIGYRGEYLLNLANSICDKGIDLESWRNKDVSTMDLYKQIKSIKGFGDYAAGSILKLLGRFDKIGIDTACRSVFKERYSNGQQISDKNIQDYYNKFGQWQGLVSWFDIMQVNLQSHL